MTPYRSGLQVGSAFWLSAGMAIGSLKTTTRECKVVSRVLDSLERVWYFSRAAFQDFAQGGQNSCFRMYQGGQALHAVQYNIYM